MVRFHLLLLTLLHGIAASVGAEEKPLLEWGKDLFVTYCARVTESTRPALDRPRKG